jgi:hypothetical protein
MTAAVKALTNAGAGNKKVERLLGQWLVDRISFLIFVFL